MNSDSKPTCKQNPLLRRIILVQPDQNYLVTVNGTDLNKGIPKSFKNKLKKLKDANRKIWWEKNFIILIDNTDRSPEDVINRFYKGRVKLWVGKTTKYKTFKHIRLYLQQEPETKFVK